MLGLLPLGGRVLNSLDLKKEYFNNSIQMDNYEVHESNGELIKSFPLDFINENYGSYRGIRRSSLIDLLLSKIDKSEIKFGTKVSYLKENNGKVEVKFSDNSSQTFNLVVAADGLHSETRKLILNKDQYEYYETGWGGWVKWLNTKSISTYKEYWGAGSFLGLYPIKDKIGIFLGGSIDKIKKIGLDSFVNEIQNEISDKYEFPKKALEIFKDSEEPFFWDFHDCRTDSWIKGNIVLLGDSAAGFLPTAGVGASMAMDSAAALADEITRMDKEHINYGLKLFSKRQKEKVEKAQDDSRKLGKWMFIDSNIATLIRDKLLPYYSLQSMLEGLSKIIEGE